MRRPIEKAGFDLIDGLGSDSNLDVVYGVVSATMSVVNSANCTLAPNCTLLHREKCASVDHTCGECSTGYSGVLGWSNIACYNSSSEGVASRRRLSEQREHRYLQTSCTMDDDCEGFAVCMATTNFGFTSFHCAVPPKTCPNDCSGQGSCKFVKVGSTAAVSSIQVVNAQPMTTRV